MSDDDQKSSDPSPAVPALAEAPTLAEALERLGRKLIRDNPEEAAELLDRLPLEDRAALVMRLRGRDRLELLLLSRQTTELVRALPAPELWLSIKEIGEEDSIELIRRASPEQLQYLVDVEWWHHDVIDPLAVAYWFMLMNEGGTEVVSEWFRHADEELLVTVFSRFFEVYQPDPDNEGAEPWRSFQNLWTLDDAYFLHFREPTLAPTVERALASIRAEHEMKYYGLLDAIGNTVLIEEEAQAFRFRSARLADYGFVEFDEAFEVYAPISGRELAAFEEDAATRKGRSRIAQTAPEYPLALSQMPPLLGRALPLVKSREALEDLALGLGALANRIMIADAMDLTRLDSVSAALAKAHVFVELGLLRWSKGDLERAAGLLETQHPFTFFRAGYTRVAALAKKARALAKIPWFAETTLAAQLLGDDGAIVRGLAQPRPRFYLGADDKGAPRYGEFGGEGDVKRAETAADRAPLLGRLFFEALALAETELKLLNEHRQESDLTFSHVLLTGVANALAGGDLTFRPLTLADARAALEIAFTAEPPHQLREDVAEQLQEKIARALGRLPDLAESDLALARDFVTACLADLDDEVKALDFADLDPRFLQSLVISG